MRASGIGQIPHRARDDGGALPRRPDPVEGFRSPVQPAACCMLRVTPRSLDRPGRTERTGLTSPSPERRQARDGLARSSRIRRESGPGTPGFGGMMASSPTTRPGMDAGNGVEGGTPCAPESAGPASPPRPPAGSRAAPPTAARRGRPAGSSRSPAPTPTHPEPRPAQPAWSGIGRRCPPSRARRTASPPPLSTGYVTARRVRDGGEQPGAIAPATGAWDCRSARIRSTVREAPLPARRSSPATKWRVSHLFVWVAGFAHRQITHRDDGGGSADSNNADGPPGSGGGCRMGGTPPRSAGSDGGCRDEPAAGAGRPGMMAVAETNRPPATAARE